MEKQERAFTLTVDKWNSGGMMEKEIRIFEQLNEKNREIILNLLEALTGLPFEPIESAFFHHRENQIVD